MAVGAVPKSNAKALAHSSKEGLCSLPVRVVLQGLLPGISLPRGGDGCLQDGPVAVSRGRCDVCHRSL